MKFLKRTCIVLFALASVAFGLLLLLEDDKRSSYIGIYED